jgi:hypothetical protein
MHKKRKMETPTRIPKALAMPLVFASVDAPPLNMKYRAAARLPKITMNANVTKYVMNGIIL